jgi:hypothetical protein
MPFSLFFGNLILIVIIPSSNMYYLFSGHDLKQIAIWNIWVTCYGVLILVSTALFIS